ncbi:MAG: Hsp20/alpha crystallin family protein [Firmicutes bacterium]|nr:Hsp20/alpha crystallin family protein [Bacillota bacterium]
MFDLVPFRKKNEDLMKSIFGKEFMDSFFNSELFNASSSGIRADIRESEKEYIIEADLPGVNKEAIEVELRDNYLTISAKHNEELNEERENYIRRERRAGKIARSFYVENVKNQDVKASYQDGVLSVVLPKTKENKPKGYKIDIH